MENEHKYPPFEEALKHFGVDREDAKNCSLIRNHIRATAMMPLLWDQADFSKPFRAIIDYDPEHPVILQRIEGQPPMDSCGFQKGSAEALRILNEEIERHRAQREKPDG